jgi:hypothetical protein
MVAMRASLLRILRPVKFLAAAALAKVAGKRANFKET